ncbi:hypothetical protein INR49_014078 [Caranx melampygus]|nr:hypothetical protein INR49_014078 [Caranx melampygus]
MDFWRCNRLPAIREQQMEDGSPPRLNARKKGNDGKEEEKGGRRKAADIKIDPCQHAAIVDTTRDTDNCGWCEDQQTRTHVSGETEKTGDKKKW